MDYAAIAESTADNLRDAGAITTVTSERMGDYDPATSGSGAGVITTILGYGAIFDYNSTAYGNQPDALIRAGDRQLLLAARDVNGNPIAEWMLPVDATVIGPDGGKYLIKNLKTIGPAGVPVLYDITVRRG